MGLAMQLMASFDHRSPHRLVVTVVGATTLMASASAVARGVYAPVVLADLEAGAAGVGADGVGGLVHAGGDQDHAAERALAAGHRGHALVVDAVLEVDDHAVWAWPGRRARAPSPTPCRRTSPR